MVIMEIGVGTNVPINFRECQLVHTCYFPMVGSFLFGILRRWMCNVFTCIFHGFNLFSKEIMVGYYLIIASKEACALLCKFRVMNMDLVRLFHAHMVDFMSPYR